QSTQQAILWQKNANSKLESITSSPGALPSSSSDLWPSCSIGLRAIGLSFWALAQKHYFSSFSASRKKRKTSIGHGCTPNWQKTTKASSRKLRYGQQLTPGARRHSIKCWLMPASVQS